MQILKGTNTIHEKMFYWDDPKTGYRISVVKGPDSLLTDQDLKDILLEQIHEYKNA